MSLQQESTGKPVKILMLDCSGAEIAVGLVLDQPDSPAPPPLRQTLRPGKSEQILPLIEKAMQHTEFGDLSAIAVTIGPGSFTGIRVGMALAMGLAAAWDLPLFGIDYFSLGLRRLGLRRLGHGSDSMDKNPIVILVDSRRHSLYRRIYRCDREILIEADEKSYQTWYHDLAIGECYVIGNGADLIDQAAARSSGITPIFPDDLASDWQAMSDCAWQAWRDFNQTGILPDIAPLYIRPADVTLAKGT